jgi:hypothetical protein
MLSPNARSVVPFSATLSFAVTENVHAALAPTLSVALHVTVVEPRVKVLPEAGVQLLVTGATPPDEVGAVNVTATDAFGVPAVTFAGHVNVSAGTGVGIGEGPPGGVAPQPAATMTISALAKQRKE